MVGSRGRRAWEEFRFKGDCVGLGVAVAGGADTVGDESGDMSTVPLWSGKQPTKNTISVLILQCSG